MMAGKMTESDMKRSRGTHTDDDALATNQSSQAQFLLSKDIKDEQETRI